MECLIQARLVKAGFMVFVLDNYDSFTYNLVQYLGNWATVEVRRNDQCTVEDVEAPRSGAHPDLARALHAF